MSRALTDLDKWKADVHDPAEAAAGEPRAWHVKHAEASYRLAPLPDGRWAVQVRCAYTCGDRYTMSIPWRDFPSREACLAFFREQARLHFGRERYRVAGDQVNARTAMRELLAEMRLAVEPVADAASAEAAAPERETAADKPPVQGLLF